jgi:hypothetical protein
MTLNSAIFARLHNDKMTIFRWEEVVIDGFTRHMEVEKYKDVQCRLSKEKLGKLKDEDIANITMSHKIFTGPDVDILEGDRVVVIHKGRTKEFKVGECFPYQSHQEVDVMRVEMLNE